MLPYVINLLLSLKAQNCSLGLMLRGNETPILNSVLREMRNEEYFEYSPLMLPGPENDPFAASNVEFVSSSVKVAKFKARVDYTGEPVTGCFAWMLENVASIADKHAIPVNAAIRKVIFVLGDHDFESPDESDAALVHLNKFGLAQIYCPSFNKSFWAGMKCYRDQQGWNFPLDDLCPLNTYVR